MLLKQREAWHRERQPHCTPGKTGHQEKGQPPRGNVSDMISWRGLARTVLRVSFGKPTAKKQRPAEYRARNSESRRRRHGRVPSLLPSAVPCWLFCGAPSLKSRQTLEEGFARNKCRSRGNRMYGKSFWQIQCPIDRRDDTEAQSTQRSKKKHVFQIRQCYNATKKPRWGRPCLAQMAERSRPGMPGSLLRSFLIALPY